MTMTTEALGETIRRVLRDAPFAMRQLASDSGLSYDVLRSWRSGRRRPSRSSAQRLADGLEKRGHQLLVLSRQLRHAAEERPEDGGAAGTAGTAGED
jgi:transcriptional regulator with XRE-family HTH domain